MTTADRPPHARIATAGWAIPRAVANYFPADGSSLARYAACFDAVEVNSTFYRSHRASTYDRWAEATPERFRFAVKLPRAITHDARLEGAAPLIATFRDEVRPLGAKLGPLLIQLPPSLAFEWERADRFFSELRQLWPEAVVCEPRHKSWFEAEADDLLTRHRIARVAADPPHHPAASKPGGWKGLSYWRLHGSPRIYYSHYPDSTLRTVDAALRASNGPAWCVFDNTASGAAAADALRLKPMLEHRS